MKSSNWRKIENKTAVRRCPRGTDAREDLMQMQPIPTGANILVVEDEALIGEMQVDALFTDIHLPGGMDGSELASRVRSLRPDMPIVYASGQWRPAEREHLVSRSVFLPKPYDPRDAGSLLLRLVATH